MVAPADEPPRRLQRPSMAYPSPFIFWMMNRLGPLGRWWLERRWKRRLKVCESILHEWRNHKTPITSFGRPTYRLPGDGFGWIEPNGRQTTPDYVDVHRWQGCIIDVWYRAGEVIYICPQPCVSFWDVMQGRLRCTTGGSTDIFRGSLPTGDTIN
jgi:hypothetical protein